MRPRFVLSLLVAASIALLGCGTKPATETSAGRSPVSTVATPSTPTTKAGAPPASRQQIKATPECQGMYRMQSLRLRISGATGADKQQMISSYQTTAAEVKQQAPQIASQLDQRVAFTLKAAAGPALSPDDKKASDAVDVELDKWWDANCVG